MFHSKDVVIIFIFMQYTNNILDLLVTICYNIQSTVAYRSTGMELWLLFFFTQVQRDNRIKNNFDIRNWLEPFLGTYKTVQIQLRHLRTRRLIRVFTTFFQKIMLD